MSCPTCGHTMQGVGDVPAVGGDPVFWCPRCGTLERPAIMLADVPKLVERCRKLRARPSTTGFTVSALWNPSTSRKTGHE